MEQGNGYTSEGGDRTAHAERLLASRAARAHDLAFLARCTLYTSAEPCAMCAGAIYWAGIGRVVYGQTEKALKAQTGAHEENPTLDLPCATRVRRRAAGDRSRRPAARGRGGRAAGGFLEGEITGRLRAARLMFGPSARAKMARIWNKPYKFVEFHGFSVRRLLREFVRSVC